MIVYLKLGGHIMNIVELLTSTTSRLPNQPVIYFRRTPITYKQLQDKVYNLEREKLWPKKRKKTQYPEQLDLPLEI